MYELSTAVPTTPVVTQTPSGPTSSPSLGIKQKIGDYDYQGCYTEATNMRALTGATHYDYPAMTLEECADDCAGFEYFGVEYSGECEFILLAALSASFLLIVHVGYCGDNLNPGSVITDDSRCSFICPGDSYEYCGASLLLSLYKLGPPGPTHLALYVQPDEEIHKRGIYNTPIIVTNGGLVADCADANYFYMVNGSLYEEGLLVGANEGLPNELFWGETTPGQIQSTFSIVDNVLQWTNESFTSGQASFCVVDDILIAVFNGIEPSGCNPVYIGVANFSTCHLNLPKFNISNTTQPTSALAVPMPPLRPTSRSFQVRQLPRLPLFQHVLQGLIRKPILLLFRLPILVLSLHLQ